MIRIAAIGLLTFGTAVGMSAQSGASKELMSLQGTWVMTSINGEVVDGTKPELTMTFTNDRYSQALNGQVVERGTIKLDPSKKPMPVDFVIAEGKDANTTQLGVIQITDEGFTAKLNAPGAPERPADFTPADGFLVFVMAKRGKATPGQTPIVQVPTSGRSAARPAFAGPF
jgi:uncharacterized protein (TIGR03067 family)